MDDHGHGLLKPDDVAQGYSISGKVMLTSVITFFLLVLLFLCFHLYSRWFLRRSRHRRRFLFATRLTSCGLHATAIAALPTFVYSVSDSTKALECAVCLSEFEEGETGRVLPKCCHRFHVECIDRWLGSRSTCPVCRVPVRPEPMSDPCCGTDSVSSETRDVTLPPPVECSRKSPDLEGILVDYAGEVGNRAGS